MKRILLLGWRNIGRNPRRSVLSITAVAVATMAIVFLFSYIEGMKQDMAQNLIRYYNGEVRVRHSQYGAWEHLNPLHLSVADLSGVLADVDAVPEVAAVVPRLSVPGAVFRDDRRIGLQITGVDFDRERSFSGIQERLVLGTLEDVYWDPSRPLAPDARRTVPVIVGRRVLERLAIDRGDQFTVVVRTGLHGTNAMTFVVAAVADFPVSSLNEVAVWAPLERVQHLARMPDQAGEVHLRLHREASRPNQREATMAGITAAVAGSNRPLEAKYWEDIPGSYQFIAYAQRIYTFVALIFFILASTVIINTTMMVIFERRKEIGTLNALGMSQGNLIGLFFTESALLGGIGAFAGLLGGVAVTLLVGRWGINFGAAMEGIDMEISTILYPVLNVRTSIGVFFYSFAVSAATSYIPTRRIISIAPVEALREE